MRGAGLLLALELGRPAAPVALAALEHGLLVGTAGDTALRITPPLTISAEETDLAIELLQARCSHDDEAGAPGRDPPARPGAATSRRRPSSPRRCTSEGIEAVQATVSRDIAQLGLVKVRNGNGKLDLRPARRRRPPPARRSSRPRSAAGRSRITPTGQLLVIQTPRGFAAALADAIDEADLPDVAGTVAGDNTIFVAVREGSAAAELADQFGHIEGAS